MARRWRWSSAEAEESRERSVSLAQGRSRRREMAGEEEGEEEEEADVVAMMAIVCCARRVGWLVGGLPVACGMCDCLRAEFFVLLNGPESRFLLLGAAGRRRLPRERRDEGRS